MCRTTRTPRCAVSNEILSGTVSVVCVNKCLKYYVWIRISIVLMYCQVMRAGFVTLNVLHAVAGVQAATNVCHAQNIALVTNAWSRVIARGVTMTMAQQNARPAIPSVKTHVTARAKTSATIVNTLKMVQIVSIGARR